MKHSKTIMRINPLYKKYREKVFKHFPCNIYRMENNTEEIIVTKKKNTNAERIKKWKLLHRKKYLYDKQKLNTWNKYKKIYLNILL